MKLIGLSILVAGKERFCGKLGLCPTNASAPHLAGQAVFYRDLALWADGTCLNASAVATDSEVWDKARALGAKFFISYFKDVNRLVIASDDVVDAAPKTDLGEGVQYRPFLTHCEVIEGVEPIPMGWTATTMIVGTPRTLKQVIAERKELHNYGKCVELTGGWLNLAKSVNDLSLKEQRKNNVRVENLQKLVTNERGEFFQNKYKQLSELHRRILDLAHGITGRIHSLMEIMEILSREHIGFQALAKKEGTKAYKKTLTDATKTLKKLVDV